MAIDESPGPRCWSTRHQLTPPPMAAAFVRETNRFLNAWSPRCQQCVDQLAELVDTHVLVAYLDPTRQRRPQPDPDQPACGHDHDPTDVAYWADGVCAVPTP